MTSRHNTRVQRIANSSRLGAEVTRRTARRSGARPVRNPERRAHGGAQHAAPLLLVPEGNADPATDRDVVSECSELGTGRHPLETNFVPPGCAFVRLPPTNAAPVLPLF